MWHTFVTIVRAKCGNRIDPNQIGQYLLLSSQESIDGLLFSNAHTVILLHIILATEDQINVQGVMELHRGLLATIGNIAISLVISENAKRHYTRSQTLPLATLVLPRLNTIDIKQFRLVYTNEKIKVLSAQGPFELKEPNIDEKGRWSWSGHLAKGQ